MRVAVIDLGTNTFNLLVRDTRDHEEVHSMKLPVKLGQGGFDKKEISEAAIDRGIEALRRYRRIIDSLDVNAIYAFGTSALRDARNRQEFLDRVKLTCGFKVNVISGDEEADMIFEGVGYGMDISHQPYLIMDIGGGSTEFILVRDGRKTWSRSFQIGSSRLRDRFPVSDPLNPEEISTIKSYLDTELAELWEILDQYPVYDLIGSSGSFETMAQVAIARRGHPNEGPPNGFKIDKDEYADVLKYILQSSLQERLADPAIIDMRADMIVFAAVLVQMVMERLKIENIILSNFALKEGVFSKILENKLTWQKS